MAEKGFEPLTSQLGISGTSHRLQLGLINGKWASRILKGKNIIDSNVFKDEDVRKDQEGNERPNQNLIVGWVLKTVAIPNINPHQIMKTTQALVNQAVKNKKKQKVKMAVSDSKEVELEKVPDSEIRRPKAQGWVKEEGEKTKDEELEEKRKAFKERVKERKQEEVKTVQTSRKLPSIPSGSDQGGARAQPKAEPKKDVTPAGESRFCPHCGKDLTWKYCPYCGKPLPHEE